MWLLLCDKSNLSSFSPLIYKHPSLHRKWKNHRKKTSQNHPPSYQSAFVCIPFLTICIWLFSHFFSIHTFHCRLQRRRWAGLGRIARQCRGQQTAGAERPDRRRCQQHRGAARVQTAGEYLPPRCVDCGVRKGTEKKEIQRGAKSFWDSW